MGPVGHTVAGSTSWSRGWCESLSDLIGLLGELRSRDLNSSLPERGPYLRTHRPGAIQSRCRVVISWTPRLTSSRNRPPRSPRPLRHDNRHLDHPHFPKSRLNTSRHIKSFACLWCRRAMVRGWWSGIRYWSKAASTSSLAIISVLSPAGLPDAARRLRRGLRDVRDHAARRWKRWRTVSFAGLMGGDRKALVIISHQGVHCREVLDVLRRRWPDVVVKELEHEDPTWTMRADDAADLGSRRRGAEPLRIVVMPQRVQRVTVAPASVIVEPMPVVI